MQTSGRGTFVPLAFEPGEAFQFDWSEDWGKRLLGEVVPHMMDPEIAERHGSVPDKPLDIRPGQAKGSAISDLWDYLAGPDAKCLEQEDLDPTAP